MASRLGCSKKTIQNYESGYSSPSIDFVLQWFKALGLQPLPYFIENLYGRIAPQSTDAEIEAYLFDIIRTLPMDHKRKLLYMLCCNHGSSPAGILNMITAHLHIHLKDRLNIAQNIISNYEIADAQGNLIETDHILPDMDCLIQSYQNAKEAVKQNKEAYFNTDK